jgi:hypothetical protein
LFKTYKPGFSGNMGYTSRMEARSLLLSVEKGNIVSLMRIVVMHRHGITPRKVSFGQLVLTASVGLKPARAKFTDRPKQPGSGGKLVAVNTNIQAAQTSKAVAVDAILFIANELM